MYNEFLKDVCEHIVDEFGTSFDGPLMDTIPGYIDLLFPQPDGDTLRIVFAPNAVVTVSMFIEEAGRKRSIALTMFSAMDRPTPEGVAITVLDPDSFRPEDQEKIERVVALVQDGRGFLLGK